MFFWSQSVSSVHLSRNGEQKSLLLLFTLYFCESAQKTQFWVIGPLLHHIGHRCFTHTSSGWETTPRGRRWVRPRGTALSMSSFQASVLAGSRSSAFFCLQDVVNRGLTKPFPCNPQFFFFYNNNNIVCEAVPLNSYMIKTGEFAQCKKKLKKNLKAQLWKFWKSAVTVAHSVFWVGSLFCRFKKKKLLKYIYICI